MNANLIAGVARAIVPAAVAYGVAKGWFTQSNAADIGAALVALGSAGWSVSTNVEK